jgi:uncharacterized membrane protein
MTGSKNKVSSRIKKNLRNRFITGVLLIMPFGVTLLVMRWLFGWLAGFLRPMFLKAVSVVARDPNIQTDPAGYLNVALSVLSIFVLLALVYLVGVFGHYVFGKRVIAAGESILLKIPLVRSIYAATKQVMHAISLPDKAAFRSVVLIEFPRPGIKAVGFLTGYIEDSTGAKYCKVFIPTTPNPTTGFFEIVPVEEIVETNVSIEDGFKMIISGGILSPDVLTVTKAGEAPDGRQQKQAESSM